MRMKVPTFVGAAFAMGAGCIFTEAFIQPSVAGKLQAGAGIAPASAAAVPAKHKSSSTALGVVRRPNGRQAAPAAGRSRKPGLRPSARGAKGPDGVEGGKPRTGKAKQRATGGGGGGNRLVPRLSPPAAAVSQLRRAAVTTLAAVLLVASSSTEQDIMTAMMGLDPSIANVGAQQQQQPSAMALPKEDQAALGRTSPNLGSIDLTGQSSGAGEIPGGVGGGFREGRLMIDQDSDLAMMLGKKMKNPDAEPRTH